MWSIVRTCAVKISKILPYFVYLFRCNLANDSGHFVGEQILCKWTRNRVCRLMYCNRSILHLLSKPQKNRFVMHITSLYRYSKICLVSKTTITAVSQIIIASVCVCECECVYHDEFVFIIITIICFKCLH